MKSDTTHGPIHDMLRTYRAINDIEQDALAKEIGIMPSSLCRFEKGKQLDAQSTVKLVAWLWGVA